LNSHAYFLKGQKAIFEDSGALNCVLHLQYQDQYSIALKILEKVGWEMLQHSTYHPDLSHIDFSLFGFLNKLIGGHKFEHNKYSNMAVI
jgi:hypothetical protein